MIGTCTKCKQTAEIVTDLGTCQDCEDRAVDALIMLAMMTDPKRVGLERSMELREKFDAMFDKMQKGDGDADCTED